MKMLSFLLLLSPLSALAQSSMLNIGSGDALILSKDLEIPANASVIGPFGGASVGWEDTGCMLVVTPAANSRLLPKGTRLVFSGANYKEVTSQPVPYGTKFFDNYYYYKNFAAIKDSHSVKEVQCYSRWGGSYPEDRYFHLPVWAMVNIFGGRVEFVKAPPRISD